MLRHCFKAYSTLLSAQGCRPLLSSWLQLSETNGYQPSTSMQELLANPRCFWAKLLTCVRRVGQPNSLALPSLEDSTKLMANYTATTDMTLEQAITNGSMADGENLTIKDGAVITCDQTPTKLIGTIYLTNGQFFVDGVNISADNMIHLIGEQSSTITSTRRGTFKVRGGWYDLEDTDGSDDQSISLAGYQTNQDHKSVIPAIWVETGRRIDFDNSDGVAPEVNDFVFKVSDPLQRGLITQVEALYLVVKWFTGALANDDAIEVLKVVDDSGPKLEVSWTANVNNVSGDIKEAGVYQSFGNSRVNNTDYRSAFPLGLGGFVFDCAHEATTLTMGHSTNGGWVPPSGCNIRVPNVVFSTTSLASYGTGTITVTDTEANEWELSTNSGGVVDFDTALLTNVYFIGLNCTSWSTKRVGWIHQAGAQGVSGPTYYDDVAACNDPSGGKLKASTTGLIRGNDVPGTTTFMDNILITQNRSDYTAIEVDAPTTLKNCILQIPWEITGFSYGSGGVAIGANVIGVELNNTIAVSSSNTINMDFVFINSGTKIVIKNFYYSMTSDYTNTATSSANNPIAFVNAGLDTFYLENFQVIGDGQHLSTSTGVLLLQISNSFKLRAIGTPDRPFKLFGTTCSLIYHVRGPNVQLDIARVYISGGDKELFDGYGTISSLKIFNSGDADNYAGLVEIFGKNTEWRGVNYMGDGSGPGYGTVSLPGYDNADSGYIFHDVFISDTVGQIGAVFLAPNAENNFYLPTTGTPQAVGDGSIAMASGDVLEVECHYFTLGHDSFTGDFTVYAYSGLWGADEQTNMAVDFKYDTGAGYNADWLDMRTPANLQAVSGMAGGIKLKYRLTANADIPYVDGIYLETNSSLSSRASNLYPIDQTEYTLTLTGMLDGSDIVLLEAGTETQILDVQENSGTTYSHVYLPPDIQAIDIGVFLAGRRPFYIRNYNLAATDATLPIAQVFDRSYET